MRVLSWNCRGLGKSSTVLQCQKIALKFKPDVLFLMETRLIKDKGKGIWNKCGFLEGWECPREGFSGGLVLGWNPKQKLQIIQASRHLVHNDLLDNKGNLLSITFIYGQLEVAKREEVWNDLRNIRNLAHSNWLCIGDFNQVLNDDEKFSFRHDPIPRSSFLLQLIFDLGFCELTASGQKYTWMNMREDEEFVMERLDRAYASVDWVNAYPNYSLRNLPIVRSDHGPIILDFDLKQSFGRRPFRFEHMWMTHPSCLDVVQ